MNNISLNQFGAVLTFAIEIEQHLMSYYENMELRKNNSEVIDLFDTRVKLGKQRAKNLERARRENVTEITLEPIEGLSSSDYTLKFTDFDRSEIIHNENLLCKFYRESGPKINVLETQRLFRKCLAEHIKFLEN